MLGMPYELKLFWHRKSAIYLGKMMALPVMLSVIVDCFSVGISDAVT